MRGRRQTGENIRETFLAELESRGISEAQVGAAICNNASNMTKAFNMTENFDDDWKERVPDPEDSEEHEANETPTDYEPEDAVRLPAVCRARLATGNKFCPMRGRDGVKMLTLMNATVN